MSAFPEGLVLAGEFSDFDALAAATAGWDLTYSQLGSGAFSGAMQLASTAQLQLVHETWSAPLLVEGGQPGDAISIAFALSAPAGLRWLGVEYDWMHTIIGGTPGHEVNFHSQGATEIVAVSIDHLIFERHLKARFGIEGATLGRDLSLRVMPGTANCIERGQAVNILRSVMASGAARTQAARHHLQEAVLQIVLDGLDMGAEARPASLTTRRRTAMAARAALRGRLDDPPSLTELCQLTRSSERTLHAAFQEYFGLPPMRYLRMLRLNAARRRLRRREGSVTSVAADLGFFHFARFAEEYRALFHQLPSETLRQARLEAGG